MGGELNCTPSDVVEANADIAGNGVSQQWNANDAFRAVYRSVYMLIFPDSRRVPPVCSPHARCNYVWLLLRSASRGVLERDRPGFDG